MSGPGAESTGVGGWVASLESAGVPVAAIRASVATVVSERPEAAVAGAFVVGLLMAMIVRRLGG